MFVSLRVLLTHFCLHKFAVVMMLNENVGHSKAVGRLPNNDDKNQQNAKLNKDEKLCYQQKKNRR